MAEDSVRVKYHASQVVPRRFAPIPARFRDIVKDISFIADGYRFEAFKLEPGMRNILLLADRDEELDRSQESGISFLLRKIRVETRSVVTRGGSVIPAIELISAEEIERTIMTRDQLESQFDVLYNSDSEMIEGKKASQSFWCYQKRSEKAGNHCGLFWDDT